MVFINMITIVCIMVVLLCVKSIITFSNREKILNAIFMYELGCFDENCEPLVTPDDMELYEITLFRFWDWGYKNIVSKDKFEIIKEFIV